MKTKPKISIIVPIYNVEKHLKQCIHSIVNQTYQNIEIICIDDCSPDNSIIIVKEYKKKDNRIKIFTNEKNLGVDKTRFIGINNSIGKYLFFIDSDDWLTKNCIELLVKRAEETNSDIVYGGITKVMDKFKIIKSKSRNSYYRQNLLESISDPELFDDYYISYFGVNKLSVSMFAKLYRTDLIEKSNINPSYFKMGEDLIFNLQIHPFISKVSFVDENIYFYRYGGMTSSSNPYFLKNIKKQYIIKEKYIQQYNYTKAEDYIRYELINCFYSHFNNLLILDNRNLNEVKSLIHAELADPFYNELLFKNIKLTEKGKNLKEKNVDEIVFTLQKNLFKKKIIHSMKRIISKVLN